MQFLEIYLDNKYYIGRVFRSQNNEQLYGDSADGIIVCLYPISSYWVRIHDSNYFFMATCPLIFPEILKKYESKVRHLSYYKLDVCEWHDS